LVGELGEEKIKQEACKPRKKNRESGTHTRLGIAGKRALPLQIFQRLNFLF